MNFQIFLGFIVACYLCYYLGTVAYDLLTGKKRAASEDDKVQEEAIDISDEVKEFTPVLITRPIVKKQKAAALKRKQTTGWAACRLERMSTIFIADFFMNHIYQTFYL